MSTGRKLYYKIEYVLQRQKKKKNVDCVIEFGVEDNITTVKHVSYRIKLSSIINT